MIAEKRKLFFFFSLYINKLQQVLCCLFHIKIGLLIWLTCFSSCDCFELLRQEPVTTAASCVLPISFGL